MTGFDLGQEADNEATDETTREPAETTDTDSAASIDHDADENAGDEEHSEKDPRKTPAFEFGDNLRESFYVREETMEAFEDAKDLDATRLLREHGVRKVPTREVHDAAVRLAADNPEKLAEYILNERGIDVDETEDSETI
ncbi:hypothetical protein [Halorussus salinus]|uniref:hypothetical protein n=1 Tax=Halorussus salinus TaxID=1364935 RepID=UPI001091FB23|nr:hypothetical protein [Halorussus salinus]